MLPRARLGRLGTLALASLNGALRNLVMVPRLCGLASAGI
jgi:hypothetical protein